MKKVLKVCQKVNAKQDEKKSSSVDAYAQLNEWAHSGTKESLDKLVEFIINEPKGPLRDHAKIAYEEAEFFYYSSDNEKEKKEFILAKMIHRKEDEMLDLLNKAEAAKLALQELELQKKAHDEVTKNKHRGKNEDWQYNFSEDYRLTVRARLEEIEGEIFYKSAWITEAKKMITSEKYQNIPEDVLEHIYFDSEGINFWQDDYFDDLDDDEGKGIDSGEPWDDGLELSEPPF